jgi:flagellar basal-body rod modification protein FlgD
MNTDASLSNLGILTKAEHDERELVVEARDDGLDRNAFLTLLTTQLQNQNPLDPMENEAFVAQLAQFSQLEATTQMSSSLEAMSNSQSADRIMQGASLVGKRVLASTGVILADGQNPSALELDLESGADQVEIGIYDGAGTKIRGFVVGPQTPGNKEFAWDGRLEDGTLAPSGSYEVRAAVQRGGDRELVIPKTYAPVRSVGWNPTSSDLNLKFDRNISIPLSELTRISE